MSDELRAGLSGALTRAMRERDRVALAALRSALAAVANAEAVPMHHAPAAGAVEQAAVGAGAADAPRRELTPDEVRGVVEGEVSEREHAAHELVGRGRLEDAERLRAEAAVLRAHLEG